MISMHNKTRDAAWEKCNFGQDFSDWIREEFYKSPFTINSLPCFQSGLPSIKNNKVICRDGRMCKWDLGVIIDVWISLTKKNCYYCWVDERFFLWNTRLRKCWGFENFEVKFNIVFISMIGNWVRFWRAVEINYHFVVFERSKFLL